MNSINSFRKKTVQFVYGTWLEPNGKTNNSYMPMSQEGRHNLGLLAPASSIWWHEYEDIHEHNLLTRNVTKGK